MHNPHKRRFLAAASGAMGTLLGLGTEARARDVQAGDFDVVVYGGSSAGVIAAVQARRLGRTAVLINPYGFLGGMTASGLSAADINNTAAVSGMAREFFLGIAAAYGAGFDLEGLSALQFEPHVAEAAFAGLVAAAGVPVVNDRLDLAHGVTLRGRKIVAMDLESGPRIRGRMFIDATYEGDLMAAAGVSFAIGREGNAQYTETLNGVQRADPSDLTRLSDIEASDHFVTNVDPYISPGNVESGLLPRVSPAAGRNGDGDHLVQAYNYRLTLSDDPSNQIPFDRPAAYHEQDHELLLRNFEAGDLRLPGRQAPLPNRKIDWNSFGAVAIDMAGANTRYPNANHTERREIARRHQAYIKGHMWTLAHHPRTPPSIRSEMRRWGYARDEFVSNGNFPYMLYVREGRRLIGDVVMSEHHCRGDAQCSDPIALASYPMDSHVVRYIVNEQGFAEREGVFFKLCPAPYGVSYRSIVPKRGECANLFAPVCVSASHVAFGSIRMEPVFMALGQTAAIAAGLALDARTDVQDIDYHVLKERMSASQISTNWDRR